MQYPKRNAHLAWREVDGEVVIADGARSRAYVLNRAAGAAWSLADGSLSTEDIAGRLGPGMAEGVRELFRRLGEAELVEMLQESELPANPAAELQGRDFDEAPRIVSAEALEVLATVCASGYGGAIGCRVEGSCATAYS